MTSWRLDLHFESLDEAKEYFRWLEDSTHEEIQIAKRIARRIYLRSVEDINFFTTFEGITAVAYNNFKTIRRITMEKIDGK